MHAACPHATVSEAPFTEIEQLQSFVPLDPPFEEPSVDDELQARRTAVNAKKQKEEERIGSTPGK